jgi:heme exporter protein D
MNLGPHAAFIIAAYAAALAVVIALIGWVIVDHAAQRRLLTELEARGVTRRSDKEAA